MTENEFRKQALAIVGAVESAHMNHPDFRIDGKIFATLGYPGDGWGMVKLTPKQQSQLIEKSPEAFKPCNGAWGKGGATNVILRLVATKVIKAALAAAAKNATAKTRTKKTLQP